MITTERMRRVITMLGLRSAKEDEDDGDEDENGDGGVI